MLVRMDWIGLFWAGVKPKNAALQCRHYVHHELTDRLYNTLHTLHTLTFSLSLSLQRTHTDAAPWRWSKSEKRVQVQVQVRVQVKAKVKVKAKEEPPWWRWQI